MDLDCSVLLCSFKTDPDIEIFVIYCTDKDIINFNNINYVFVMCVCSR